ncbi:uncharacterized protein LOC118203811 [Stegodyphus dumicola]|uniref:uncharacterized protein LOC118203811 n=1 Tax=Stegodyphus dumicola TaxID=202533 RepID=UPI0015A790AC|nr:uncharacterized protein LOC118203811 [Stegodyphus dumicola]
MPQPPRKRNVWKIKIDKRAINPRQFLKETQTGQDGYPLYRRRSPADGGFTASINLRGSEVSVDNAWIVPYCPLLSKFFNAHINVEYCNSVKSIKYVCKYVNKGSDMAVFDVTSGANELNEIHQYEMGRYISSNEAVWRILNFPIHERHPTVVHLSVHLENGQRVTSLKKMLLNGSRHPRKQRSHLFFKLCTQDNFARNLLYNQIPKYYTWNSRNKSWNRRKTRTNCSRRNRNPVY